MLKDRLTGYETEVDLVVTKNVGGIPVVLGIECTAEKRPATVEWVREMTAKHENLPVDKSVLVSRSGYSKQAQVLARAKGALPLTLDEAQSGDWSAFVGSLSGLRLAFTEFSVERVHLTVPDGNPGGELNLDAPLRRSDQDGTFVVRDYFEALVKRGDLFERVIRRWLEHPVDQRPSKFNFRVDTTPNTLTEVRAEDGSWKRVVSGAAEVTVTVTDRPLDLVAQRYLGHQVAHAVVPNVFQEQVGGGEEIVVNLVGGEDGLRKAGMLVSGDDGVEARYHDMTFPADPGSPDADAVPPSDQDF
jgi:hypothetical protein